MIVCGLEKIVYKELTNIDDEKVSIVNHTIPGGETKFKFSDFLDVEAAEGSLAEDCPIISYNLCINYDCTRNTLDPQRWSYDGTHFTLQLSEYMDTT